MKRIIIKENSNANFFKALEMLGCVKLKIKSGGRGEYNAAGTTGKQGRRTYTYANYLHGRVFKANKELCHSPKTSIFLNGSK